MNLFINNKETPSALIMYRGQHTIYIQTRQWFLCTPCSTLAIRSMRMAALSHNRLHTAPRKGAITQSTAICMGSQAGTCSSPSALHLWLSLWQHSPSHPFHPAPVGFVRAHFRRGWKPLPGHDGGEGGERDLLSED